MAGPTLSQILDPPQPNSGSQQTCSSLPSSYSMGDSSLQHPRHHPHHQQPLPTPSPVPRGQPTNTRKLGAAPVTLPPPTTTTTNTNPNTTDTNTANTNAGNAVATSSVPTSSILQVRPAPASASIPPSAVTSASIPASAVPVPVPVPVSAPLTVAAIPGFINDGHRRSSNYSSHASPIYYPANAVNSPAAARPVISHRGHNLYACRDCGRSYSRPEHLVRHVQTHTLGRRFVCDLCQKSFARKDLLRRHVANHANDSPKKRRRTTAPGTGRVSHACQSCASARVKCDDEKPCKRCRTRNLSCVFTESPSTAAMHLLHMPGAHSSVNPNDGEGLTVAAGDPTAASRRSISPGSLGRNQPRSLPSEAVQASPPALQQHHPQRPYAYHSRTSSIAPSCSPQRKLSGHDLRSDYAPFPEELEPAASAMDQDRLPFADFLRHVVNLDADLVGQGAIQGLKVLDYCDQGSLELLDGDFALLDYWNAEGSQRLVQGSRSMYGREPDDAAQARQGLVSMWTNSRCPEPRSQEGARNATATTGGSDSVSDSHGRTERVTSERLESSARDRILAMVLNTARRGAVTARLAASFPSVDIMDMLIQDFLASLSSQASGWVHLPTFGLNAQPTEWLAAGAAAGACLSPIPTLRKFGFILQDAARGALPTQSAGGSVAMPDVALVQAFVLVQEMGLWSGNRGRVELAQSHLPIPVTLMRNRTKFQRSSYPTMEVDPADEGPELERKWRVWIGREQWKRLVFHCFLHDARCSMVTMTNPFMSYAELMLPLPESRELWLARNASEWKAEYLLRMAEQDETTQPSLADVFHEIHLLSGSGMGVDMQFSVSVYLHGFWALVLEYRKLSAVHRPRSSRASMGASQNLLLGSRHQELVRDLQNFSLMTEEWPEMATQEHVLLHTLNMHLHVSLDDVQLFAGKEGVEQARQTYPVLQQWALSSEARTAIWCAGQVFRYAKASAPGQLRDFDAVAVEHAGLVLWTYGVVSASAAGCLDGGGGTLPRRQQQQQQQQQQQHSAKVYLDGPDTAATQKFVSFGQGRPMLRGPAVRDTVMEVWAGDAQACIDVTRDIIVGNFKDGTDSVPPMAVNLCTLLRQLSEAAVVTGAVQARAP